MHQFHVACLRLIACLVPLPCVSYVTCHARFPPSAHPTVLRVSLPLPLPYTDRRPASLCTPITHWPVNHSTTPCPTLEHFDEVRVVAVLLRHLGKLLLRTRQKAKAARLTSLQR